MVSIIVITYNSAKYVLETLESARAQTYQNIELIISDDGSQDNTVEMCKDWLSENNKCFVSTELLTVEKNTGVPANCNRGIKAAQGEWIKFIAGDDILLSTCVEDNVKYVPGKDIKILLSSVKLFDTTGKEKINGEVWPLQNHRSFFDLNAEEQFFLLIIGDGISSTPSSFIKKEVFYSVDFFDEEFPLIEDYPFWMKCTKNEFKIFFMDRITVLYRIHNSSVSLTSRLAKPLVNVVNYRNYDLVRKYCFPYFNWYGKLQVRYNHFLDGIFISQPKTNINSAFYQILVKWMNPFSYIGYINRRFFPKYGIGLKKRN